MTVSLQGSLMVDIAGKWLTAEDRHLLRQPEVAGLIILPATSTARARCVNCARRSVPSGPT